MAGPEKDTGNKEGKVTGLAEKLGGQIKFGPPPVKNAKPTDVPAQTKPAEQPSENTAGETANETATKTDYIEILKQRNTGAKRRPPTRKPRGEATTTAPETQTNTGEPITTEGSQVQKEQSTPTSPTGFFTESPIALKKQFLQNLMETLAKTDNWHTGWGGTKVQIDDSTQKVMPAHAADMYKACKADNALDDKNVEKTFATVKGILEDAQHGSQNDDVFTWLFKMLKRTLLRAKETQTFYNDTESALNKTTKPSQ